MTAIQGPSRTAAKAQSRSSSAADWTPTSWRSRPAQQMPVYDDAATLGSAEARLRRFPRWSSPARHASSRRRWPRSPTARPSCCRRRLRRELHRLHRQQHPRHLPRAAADGGRADLRRRRACREARPHGRPIRQAALVQCREGGRRRAAVLSRRQRQWLRVHRRGPQARSRAHGAGLQQSAATLNLLRAFAQGGYADCTRSIAGTSTSCATRPHRSATRTWRRGSTRR